jgi:signal transduction histidine kinase
MQLFHWKKNLTAEHALKNVVEDHYMSCALWSVVFRILSHPFFWIAHLRFEIPNAMGRQAITITFTLMVVFLYFLPKIRSRFHESYFIFLHACMILPFPIEAMIFGAEARPLWPFLCFSHGICSVLMYAKNKGKIIGYIIHIFFPFAYLLAPESPGPDQSFFLIWVALGSCTVVDIMSSKMVMRLTQTEQRVKILAAENENSLKILSHDMANILAVARDSLELVLEEVDESNGQLNFKCRDYIDDCRFAVNQGVGMLEAVRDNLAILSGKKSRFTQPFQLVDVAKDAIQLWQRSARKKNIFVTISMKAPREETLVRGSRSIFTHTLVGNLVSNAIKFSQKDSKIGVILTLTDDKRFVILDVIDEGIGIAPKKLVSLFDDTGPTTSMGTQGEAGTGFGLPLVQKTAREFGGTVEVLESTWVEGKVVRGKTGTTFRLRIPCATMCEDSDNETSQYPMRKVS